MTNSHFTPERLSEQELLEARRRTMSAGAANFKAVIYGSFEEQWSAASPASPAVSLQPASAEVPLTGAAGAVNAAFEAGQAQHVQAAQQQVEEALEELAA